MTNEDILTPQRVPSRLLLSLSTEDKELLLRDLCARLPYDVKCYYNSLEIYDELPEGVSIIKGFQNNGILVEIEDGNIIDVEDIKPYLRPMSSMTEEEKNELGRISCEGNIEHKYGIFYRSQDYLSSIHVDYRGLIEKGLALEAPEEMYKI